jgi:hypothetical protein
VSVKQEPQRIDLVSHLDSKFGSSPSGLAVSRHTVSGTVKPEPVESVVPQKRLSDSAFSLKHELNPSSNPLWSPSDKKPKLEDVKIPLSPVNRNKTTVNQAPVPPMSVEAAREKLEHVQTLISMNQTALDRINRKRSKSKRDSGSIKYYSREIVRLRAEKGELNAVIPNVSSVRRLPSVSGLNAQQPPAYISYKGSAFDRDQKCEAAKVPVASGSRVRLPVIDTPPMPMDDIQRNLEQRLADVVPPIMPLPDDHADENGDYHGRGRDRFAGPQAKADE